MTKAAKYRNIKLEDIKVDEDRQRKQYENITELADSIKEKGLLQPVGVEDETNRLVYGGRRYKAHGLIGAKLISCRIVPKGLDPIELEEIELEENIQRKDLTWQEKIDATKRIDDLKKSIHGDQAETGSRTDWSTRKTAELLGKSSGGVNDDITLAEACELFPDLRNCSTKDEARKKFKGLIEAAAVKHLVKEAKESETSSAFKFAESHYMIGDAFEGLQKLGQTTASLAIVDPPYGIGLEKQKKVDVTHSNKENLEQYNEVASKDYPRFVAGIAEELYKALGEHAWVLWWFGQEWYKETLIALRKGGFAVDKIPATWGKSGASGQTNQPELYLGRSTETFFVARKGSPAMAKRGQSNLFLCKPVSSNQKIHPTEKPILLVQDLLDIFAFPGAIIIVPFLGSGVDLRAAYSRQCTGFGWDLSEEYKEKFLYRVQEDIQEGLYE
jgi:ParB family chromosome partitioning protein